MGTRDEFDVSVKEEKFETIKARIKPFLLRRIKDEVLDELPEKTKDAYFEQIPCGRFGTTDEVSQLVNFLLSDASSYITGEVIKIDGGLYI